MRVAIMQPYFLPYIGYFQLIKAVDLFVVYDNIKYTKKGWINRNRFLLSGKDEIFSLPLKGGADNLEVWQRELAPDFNCSKLLNRLRESYRRAPFFDPTYHMLEEVLQCRSSNLFDYLHHSILTVCGHLGVATEIRRSSSFDIDHELKSQEKVLALCRAAGATTYLNSIGGRELYSKEAFRTSGTELQFIQPTPIVYPQFGDVFIPWLSILDVLMFNSVDSTRELLTHHVALS